MATRAFKSKAYTKEVATDLYNFLANPPEPPASRLSFAEVLEIIKPQAIALIKAGYTVEQIKSFLAAKHLPTTTQEAVDFLRSIAPKTPRAPARLKRTVRKPRKSVNESTENDPSDQPQTHIDTPISGETDMQSI